MTPLAFRLVPYKPYIQCAELSATGHEISLENNGWLAIRSDWQPGTISIRFHIPVIDLKQQYVTFFYLKISASYSFWWYSVM